LSPNWQPSPLTSLFSKDLAFFLTLDVAVLLTTVPFLNVTTNMMIEGMIFHYYGFGFVNNVDGRRTTAQKGVYVVVVYYRNAEMMNERSPSEDTNHVRTNFKVTE
jgi:hypothetical protein